MKDISWLAKKFLFLTIEATSIGVKHYHRKRIFKKLKNVNKLLSKKCGNKKREREAVLREIDDLPDYIFKSMFRLDRETFSEVLEKISPFMHSSNPDAAAKTSVS